LFNKKPRQREMQPKKLLQVVMMKVKVMVKKVLKGMEKLKPMRVKQKKRKNNN